jgi:hypothetical protein
VTENDYGKYYCLAKNSQGETSGEIALYGKILIHFNYTCECVCLLGQSMSELCSSLAQLDKENILNFLRYTDVNKLSELTK